jgi:hypothetical protein
MKAVFKWTYKISSEYAEAKTILDKTPDVSCFKPGNPDYDKIWGEQNRHVWADTFQNEYVTKYVNRLNEHFATVIFHLKFFPKIVLKLTKKMTSGLFTLDGKTKQPWKNM